MSPGFFLESAVTMMRKSFAYWKIAALLEHFSRRRTQNTPFGQPIVYRNLIPTHRQFDDLPSP